MLALRIPARSVFRRVALVSAVAALACAVGAPSALAVGPSVSPPIAKPPQVTQPIAPPAPGRASFVAQPVSGVAGVPWTVQPVVQLAGADPRYRYYVSLAISGGNGGLSCASTTVDMVSRGAVAVGTFSGCKVSAAGTYTLRAAVSGRAISGGGVAPTVSATGRPFPVTGAVAPVPPIAPEPAGLASFLKSPSGGAAGAAWAVQPVVRLVHAQKDFRYFAAIAIDAAHSSGSGQLRCSSLEVAMGPTGASTIDGIFSGCSISAPGTYVLRAAVSGVAQGGFGMTQPAYATSSAFYVTGTAPAAGLWFTTQPLGASAGVVPVAPSGQAWPIQPVVAVFGANGKIVTTDNTTVVTLSVAPGTPASGGPGSLACTNGNALRVTGGVARFSGCRITGPGKGYAIRAIASTALATTSHLLDISSPNGYLSFGAEGLDTTPGAVRTWTSMTPWPIEPQVTIHRPDGTVASTNNTTRITVALAGPAANGAALQCASGTTVAAVDGVATFSGCFVRGTGNFTLTATASDPYSTSPIDPATTGEFSMTANSAGILMYARDALVPAGTSAYLVAKLVGPTSATSSQTITFEAQSPDRPEWTVVGTALTDGTGNAMISTTPRFDTTYRATSAATGSLAAATSNLVPVGVSPSVKVSPVGAATVAPGASVTYKVTVSPVPIEQETASTVTLLVYEKVNGVWTYRNEQSADVSTDGTASFTWTWATAGTWAYGVRANAGPLWQQGATSPSPVTVQ